MNKTHLNLLFPQWQGSGESKELYFGAKEIEKHLYGKLQFKEIEVKVNAENEITNGIFAYNTILEQLNNARKIVSSLTPQKILTIGGDCGVELVPVSFLNRQYSGDLGIIWFDAHGDLNIPEESPSHHFHGMPLRALLGDGDENIIQSCFSTIMPDQIYLLGGREFDNAETAYIKKRKLKKYSSSQIAENREILIKSIQNNRFNKLYIHIDLDVLNPNEFPYVKCPTKGGFSKEVLIDTIQSLKNNFTIVGFSIVEYTSNNSGGDIEFIKELLKTSSFL